MDNKYIESLTQSERAGWGIQVFIRLWMSGMCRSQAAQNWTIAQIAILLEVTQAYLFREEAHTATSLSKELRLPMQTVSRTVRDLQKMGLLSQQEADNDARKKFLCPADDFFDRDGMANTIQEFASSWFHGWDQLDKARGAEWFIPMSECSTESAQKQIKQFKNLVDGVKK